jgi:hypothetical protein
MIGGDAWWLHQQHVGTAHINFEERTQNEETSIVKRDNNQNPPDKHKGCQLTREMRKKPKKEKMTRYCV